MALEKAVTTQQVDMNFCKDICGALKQRGGDLSSDASRFSPDGLRLGVEEVSNQKFGTRFSTPSSAVTCMFLMAGSRICFVQRLSD